MSADTGPERQKYAAFVINDGDGLVIYMPSNRDAWIETDTYREPPR